MESYGKKRYGRYIDKNQSYERADGKVAYFLEARGKFRKISDFCY